MLQKRIIEGFEVSPVVLCADTEADAFEMEELLISMIGREDLGTGTLFNHTNGGEGSSGRVVSEQERAKRSVSLRAMPPDAKKNMTAKIQAARARFMKEHPGAATVWAEKSAAQRRKPCTVDGSTIYNSRIDLINALGQSSTGSRAPTFRYISEETI